MGLSRRVPEWLALVCAAALAGCGAGGGAGLGALNLGTDLVVADLDGDGRADVLALTHEFGEQPVIGRLHVRRQNAEGAFGAAETHRVGCYPWSMTLASCRCRPQWARSWPATSTMTAAATSSSSLATDPPATRPTRGWP